MLYTILTVLNVCRPYIKAAIKISCGIADYIRLGTSSLLQNNDIYDPSQTFVIFISYMMHEKQHFFQIFFYFIQKRPSRHLLNDFSVLKQ